jgi:hypothetical protein
MRCSAGCHLAHLVGSFHTSQEDSTAQMGLSQCGVGMWSRGLVTTLPWSGHIEFEFTFRIILFVNGPDQRREFGSCLSVTGLSSPEQLGGQGAKCLSGIQFTEGGHRKQDGTVGTHHHHQSHREQELPVVGLSWLIHRLEMGCD